MIGSGTAIALPCAWAMGRLVEAQLDGMKPTDFDVGSVRHCVDSRIPGLRSEPK
jgi:hypothetical protein